MLSKLKPLIKRIHKKAFPRRNRKPNGIVGEVVHASDDRVVFSRKNRKFNLKRSGDRVIYSNYEDWVLIQKWKGHKHGLQDLWEKSKEKQIRNWDFGDVSKGEKLLEVGFRDGYNLRYLQEKGIDVEGIEVNPDAVEAARALNCKAYDEDIQSRTHYKDRTFDVVSACDVLEHCFSPENALKEMSRILKADGRILLEVPFETEFDRNVLHGHSVLFYNEERFDGFLASLGFRIIKKDTSIPTRNLYLLKKMKHDKS